MPTHIAKVLSAIFIFVQFCIGYSIDHDVRFEPHNIAIKTVRGYDYVQIRDAQNIGEPGHPSLPVVQIVIAVPYAVKAVQSVDADVHWQFVGDGLSIYPVQPFVPISDRVHRRFVHPDQQIYGCEEPYPDEIITDYRVGVCAGFKLLKLSICPFRYLPARGELYVAEQVKLQVQCDIGAKAHARTPWQHQVLKKFVGRLVANPHELDLYGPPVRTASLSLNLVPGDYHEVYITSEALAPSIAPVVDWRTKQGMPCTTVTVEAIVSSYDGYDTPEKIRNFIKDADTTWGALYYTLAGDTAAVPRRLVIDLVASDLYYSDLDGTWDANGNHVYGEYPDDSVDMYADVFVGRIPVETESEAEHFCTKLTTYEKSPATGYAKKCLLPACELFPDYSGNIINDSIANCTPTGWQDAKLYETDGNCNDELVVDSLNAGTGFVHYAGHGSQNGIYYQAPEETLLENIDVPLLTNTHTLNIHSSIACYAGAFDASSSNLNNDCLAENLMNHDHGGAIAVIMNSRTGLADPPNMGPSELLDLEFFRKAFREDFYRVGPAYTLAKDVYVPVDDQGYRLCIYQLNLFGDPAMPMWLDEPTELFVDHPDTVPVGPSHVTVTVTDAQGPVPDATVCLMSKPDVYEYGSTDASGHAAFDISPTQPDTLWITTTACNHLPDESFALIGAVGIREQHTETPQTAFLAPQPSVMSTRTVLRYSVARRGHVRLSIRNILGQRLGLLVNHVHEPGYYSCTWDGTLANTQLAQGVYFLMLRANGQTMVRKTLIVN